MSSLWNYTVNFFTEVCALHRNLQTRLISTIAIAIRAGDWTEEKPAWSAGAEHIEHVPVCGPDPGQIAFDHVTRIHIYLPVLVGVTAEDGVDLFRGASSRLANSVRGYFSGSVVNLRPADADLRPSAPLPQFESESLHMNHKRAPAYHAWRLQDELPLPLYKLSHG